MNKAFRIYDTHSHLGVARPSSRRCDPEEMLRHRDAAGADRSVLLPFPVVEDCRATQDEIATAVRRNCAPFLPEKEFPGEPRRAAEDLGLRALKLQPQYQALNPPSSRNDFLFGAALERRMALICPTGTGAPFALPSLFIMARASFPARHRARARGGKRLSRRSHRDCGGLPEYLHRAFEPDAHHVQEVLAHVPASCLMISSDLPEILEIETGKIRGLLLEEGKRDILSSTAGCLFDGAGE